MTAELGAPAMHPPLPTPAAWNCYWKGDNDGPSWDQWHDASDPMPEQWDGDPPDDVVPYFTGTQVFDYAGQCVKEATAECSAHWQAALDAAVAADTDLLRRALHTLVWEVGSDGLFAAQTAEVLKALRARLGA